METIKKKRGGERPKIEAGGSGGIILIGGALVAAALGAALAARRARGSTRGNRNCDAIDKKKEEEKGLRSLLPSIEQLQKGEAVSVDCLVQENTSEKSEIGETIESEGPGASCAESSADQAPWLEEVIEQRQDSASVEVNLLEQDSEMTESFEDFHREEEFDFDSLVEIQETGEIQGSYKITEMITEIKESEIEASNTGGIDGDVTGQEFSFWNGKPSTPEIHTEQNFIELVAGDVPDEKEKESCIGEDGEKREQGSQIAEASSAELSEDAAWPAMAIEQELEISEKTEDICVSEGEENIRMLQDHIPSTNFTEQAEGQVSVGSSEEAQEKACDDFEMVVEILDIPHVEGGGEEEGSSMKSQEEIELQLEDVGERGGGELEGLRNSSVEFSDQEVWPEERIEQGKVDDSMSNSEMKHQPEIPRNIIEEVDVSICRTNYDNKLAQESISESVEINLPDNETSENLHKSEADHVEVDKEADDEREGSSAKSLEEEKMLPVEEESEGEESVETGKFSIELEKCLEPMYEMKQMLEISEKIDEMVDEAHIEGTKKSEADHVEVDKEADDEQDGSSAKSLEEEKMLPVEEESEGEESIETGKFSIELEKCSEPMYEMKQMLEISEKIDEIVDEAHIEGTEKSEADHVEVDKEADDEQEGSSAKSLEEKKMLPVEEESEGEESIETGKFSIELEICSVPMYEMKQMLEILEKIDEMVDEAHIEGTEKSEADHVEVDKEADDEQEGSSAKSLEEEKMLPVEEESEGEESIETGKFSIELEKCSVPMYEMNQMLEISEKIDEMVDEAHIEGTENSTGGIQSFLLSDDKLKEVSADSSVGAQEKVYMNLDIETEVDLKHDVVKTQSYTDVAFNSSQGQNQQDREESEISHVEEEEGGVEDPSVGSQEKEKGLPSIENEMKLKYEIPKKTTDFRQSEGDKEEHEQEVPKKGSETIFTYKEKKTDFILIGSSKLFLLVLITFAVGLLVFAHHDHLHHYNLRLPKIYRQLYQLFFPSYNRALGEL